MVDHLKDRAEFARKAVAEFIPFFGERFGRVASQWKYDGSRVTEADLAISQALQSAIEARYPEDAYLSEELDSGKGKMEVRERFAWLVDPIDGTNNFARGIPACSISVALLENGLPVYGVIYDHMSRLLFHGGPGFGAWIEDEEARFSEGSPSDQSIVGCQHCGTDTSIPDDDALQKRFKIRNLGSSAIQLAYVTVGWTDGVIAHKVNSWDIAAGIAMLTAVEGRVHYFGSDPFPIREFDVRNPSFGYLAGPPRMVEAMIQATGR